MAIIRAQVVLQKKSLISRDAVTNTWHFDTGGAAIAQDFADITTALTTFYGTIDQYLSPSLHAGDVHKVKLYNFGEVGEGDFFTEPNGPPEFTNSLGILTTHTSGLPTELALCLTFEASSTTVAEELGNTRPAARRRGRVFIGPLGDNVMTVDSTPSEIYINATVRTNILNAATALHAYLAGRAAPIAHVVASRVDNAGRQVSHYSMDDAFDVMRSRGLKARSRTRVAAAAYPLSLSE